MTEKETPLRFSRMEQLIGPDGVTTLRRPGSRWSELAVSVLCGGSPGRAGVGWLVLIDHDRIEPYQPPASRLNRQLRPAEG